MAELGQTRNPRELVPGDPDAIEENARVLRTRAASTDDAGEGLRAIDTGSWEGPAARAFHDKFSYEPGKWFTAADALQAGAGALGDYTATLRWAQTQAAEAIRLWNQGEAATQQAVAEHDTALAQAGAQNQPAPPFTDPGEADRQAARETLSRARRQLAEAGDVAAATLHTKASAAPEKSSWLDDVGDFLSDAGAHVVNGVASFGNAMVNHPGDMLAAAAGIGLTALSAAGEGTGLALDATGVGAVAGVPLNVVSAAGMATGATMTGVAMANIASHAAGDDHVSPMNTSESSGTGGAGPPSETPPGVKQGWSSRTADNGKGTVYQEPGSAGNSNVVRDMEPTSQYPNGYVRFYNDHGQPVGLDGKPGPNSATHIPKAADGTYPVPEGW